LWLALLTALLFVLLFTVVGGGVTGGGLPQLPGLIVVVVPPGPAVVPVVPGQVAAAENDAPTSAVAPSNCFIFNMGIPSV